MRPSSLTALTLCLLLGACAAATPGYQPPSARLDKYKSRIDRGGGFDASGQYALTEQEKKLNCKQLTGSVRLKIVQMRDAPNRPRPSAAASLAQTTIKPFLGGSSYGASVEGDLRRDRSRLEALNGQLAAKGCATFDLEKDLAPGNTETPSPVKPQRKR